MQRLLFALLPLASVLAGCVTSPPDTATVPEALQVAPGATPKRDTLLPILFLVGDSTVYNVAPGLVGWGNVLSNHFDLSRIAVENHAKPGRSTRTFISQGWWGRILAVARPGDFVIIQMGHNDSSPVNDSSRSRGTLPGIGNESTNLVNGVTQLDETVHTYGWYLRRYISEARDVGMTPLLCTSVSRLPRPGKELDTTRYSAWAREVARAENVPLIDLNQRMVDAWGAMSIDEIRQAYFSTSDSTHFNRAGAELNARCVVDGVDALPGCSLKGYLLRERLP